MKVTNIILVSAVVVIAGKWANSQDLDIKLFIGGLFTLIIFSLLSDYNVPLATDLAMLILVSSVIINGPAIFGAVGRVTK